MQFLQVHFFIHIKLKKTSGTGRKRRSFKLELKTKEKDPVVLSVDRKCRYWTDGGIIGSKEFVKETTRYFEGEKVADKHHQANIHGQHTDEGEFYSFHRLKNVS